MGEFLLADEGLQVGPALVTREPRLWVLNFDAEDELARPGAMTPSPTLRARFEQLAQRSTLLALSLIHI